MKISLQILKDRVPNWCKVSMIHALRILFKGPQSWRVKQIFIAHGGQDGAKELLCNDFFSLPIKASIVECLCLSLLPDNENNQTEPPNAAASAQKQPESECLWQNYASSALKKGSAGLTEDLGIGKQHSVISALLKLCLGPDGPLKEISASAGASEFNSLSFHSCF